MAVNDRARAPYQEVVTHGFTLDGQGRKMSKSLDNVISPLDVAKERGAEILRLWVSMVDFLEDMRLSGEIIERNSEAYRKIRNTFRYLLGNLHDFDPVEHPVAYERMEEIDRWAVEEAASHWRSDLAQEPPHHRLQDYGGSLHGGWIQSRYCRPRATIPVVLGSRGGRGGGCRWTVAASWPS